MNRSKIFFGCDSASLSPWNLVGILYFVHLSRRELHFLNRSTDSSSFDDSDCSEDDCAKDFDEIGEFDSPISFRWYAHHFENFIHVVDEIVIESVSNRS